MRRLALAGALVCAASAVLAAEPSPDVVAEAQARPYVSGFCAPIALNDPDPAAFGQLLNAWQAKASGEAADSMPQSAAVAGQQFLFADQNAPRAFVERRRGGCSLIYKGAVASPLLTAEFKSVRLPVGEGDAMRSWRRVTTRRAGPPGPIRYYLSLGDGAVGLCATIFEDLRLRDNAPATLVKVATCRLGGDETFDNG